MRATLAMSCPVEFGTMPDCDCPFEHWHIGRAGTCLDVHLEEDGTAHFFLDTGDSDAEIEMPAMTLEQARTEAFRWAAPLIGEQGS